MNESTERKLRELSIEFAAIAYYGGMKEISAVRLFCEYVGEVYPKLQAGTLEEEL